MKYPHRRPLKRCDLCGHLSAGEIALQMEDEEFEPMQLCERHIGLFRMYLGAERYNAGVEFKSLGGSQMKLVKNGNGGTLASPEERRQQWATLEEPYLARRAAAKTSQFEARLAFVGKLKLERDRKMGLWPADPQRRRKLREREVELQREHLTMGYAARTEYIEATRSLIGALLKEAAEYDSFAMKHVEKHEIFWAAGEHAAKMRLRAGMLENALAVEIREAETLSLAAEAWDGSRASDWWREPESTWNAKPYEPSVGIYPAMNPNQITSLLSNDPNNDYLLLGDVWGEQRERAKAQLAENRRVLKEEKLREVRHQEEERVRLADLYRRDELAHSLGLGVTASDIAALEAAEQQEVA